MSPHRSSYRSKCSSVVVTWWVSGSTFPPRWTLQLLATKFSTHHITTTPQNQGKCATPQTTMRFSFCFQCGNLESTRLDYFGANKSKRIKACPTVSSSYIKLKLLLAGPAVSHSSSSSSWKSFQSRKPWEEAEEVGCVPGRHTPAGKGIGGNVFTILHTAVFREGGFSQPASATTTLNVGETTDVELFF